MSSSDFFISEHKFKEICEVINGRAYKKDELLGSGKYKVLRVGNFFTSDNWYYSDLELNNDKYCHKGDLLYSWSASFGPKIWNEDNTIFHYHIWKLVPSDIVNKMFLYYWLEDNKRIILGNLHGSVMGHLTKNAFENQKINLPPLPEQKAIAHILSTLDEKIEVNNQINKTLENIAQTIFKQWFVDFEFPNGAGEPYESSGGEMVESELGMIPKGWEVSNFDKVIKITSGKRPKEREEVKQNNHIYPLVGASSIMGYTTEYNFDEEIIVIGRVGTHGIIQRFKDKIWASDNTLVIKSIFIEYTNQILKMIDYKSLNRGSTQPLITQTDIKNHKIILPCESIINKYEEIISVNSEMIDIKNTENQKLKELRDSLLPKLMSGEIRVPIEEN